jgi:predicted nuclease of restriction endonuclease-like (RecB) superfamily
VIERLAHDLRTAFPDMKGFSRANLMYMRAFAEAWPDAEIVQQAVGQLPWGHNLVLLTKLKDPAMRLTYAQRAIQHGWSRNVLNIHIETRLLEREGQAVTNFEAQLPPQPHPLFHRQYLACRIHHRIQPGLGVASPVRAGGGAVEIHHPRAVELFFDLAVGDQVVEGGDGNPALFHAAEGEGADFSEFHHEVLLFGCAGGMAIAQWRFPDSVFILYTRTTVHAYSILRKPP